MALKGTQAKAEITEKILEVFPNSFVNDKEIRIPVMENGEEVQIKVTLTAAKTNIECGGSSNIDTSSSPSAAPVDLTAEEKDRLQKLVSSLF